MKPYLSTQSNLHRRLCKRYKKLVHVLLRNFHLTFDWHYIGQGHGLRTPREEIAFTARPKIQSQSKIFWYGQSIFCLPHRPNFSHMPSLGVRSPWARHSHVPSSCEKNIQMNVFYRIMSSKNIRYCLFL